MAYGLGSVMVSHKLIGTYLVVSKILFTLALKDAIRASSQMRSILGVCGHERHFRITLNSFHYVDIDIHLGFSYLSQLGHYD